MQTAATKPNQYLMTQGNITRQLILFCIPLLLGNLFQLLYNTVDSIVVGNYIGSVALAAVGAATPVINLFVSFFVGLSAGAGVIVARRYGAQDVEGTQKAVHTFLTFAIEIGLVLSVMGVLLTTWILKWIGVPEDVFPQAEQYLATYFVGNVFVTIYNAGTGILQAVGDAKHPLYFLAAASVVNIVLDLWFVGGLDMGVAGAALATILSQAVSAVLVWIQLARTTESYRLYWRLLRIHPVVLREILRYGIPAGVQQTIVSLSNVVVQSYVNTFGASAIAGYSSANKYDNFLLLPVNSFGLAAATFTGQNLGARQFDRVRRGVRTALVLSIGTVGVLGLLVYWQADLCISCFSQEKDVVAAGASLIRIMCPFYSILCFHQVFTGALRACGRSYIPMITAIVSFVVYRQIFLALVLPQHHTIEVIGWGFSSSWVLSALLTSGYYFASHWLQHEARA